MRNMIKDVHIYVLDIGSAKKSSFNVYTKALLKKKIRTHLERKRGEIYSLTQNTLQINK
jgi:hypothetical protein